MSRVINTAIEPRCICAGHPIPWYFANGERSFTSYSIP